MPSTAKTTAASRIVLSFLLRCIHRSERNSAILIALEQSMPPIVDMHTWTKTFLAELKYIGLAIKVS